MNVASILYDIDAELSRLRQARAALAVINTEATALHSKRRGRPKGSHNIPKPTKAKRTMSAEGRAKIAAAQKKRWAASKQLVPAKAAPAKVPAKGAAKKFAKKVAAKSGK